MQLPDVYFATYDTSMSIIPATAHLWQKYYSNSPRNSFDSSHLSSHSSQHQQHQQHFLGYKLPEMQMPNEKLPCVHYISLAPSRNSFKEWSRNLRSHLIKLTNEFIVFTIDDNFLIDYANVDLIDMAVQYMNQHSDVACCYGSIAVCYGNDDRKWQEDDRIIRKDPERGFLLYEASKSRYHLVNLQPNIWRRSVLCDILNNDFDIYDFEVKGSNLMRETKWRFIGLEKDTNNDNELYKKCLFPNMYYTACSESRNPGKISVLGLRNSDVQELIDLNYISKERLVYGYHSSYAIPYSSFTFDSPNRFNMEEFESVLRRENKIRPGPMQQLGTVPDSLLGFKRVLGPLYVISK